ncbi:MAG TPA: phosphatase [Bacteroidia bacterium]|nr:phosphatase [Bacteroidia bacterium]
MRIAIIDLGTNTFNLLIAEIFPDGQHKRLFNVKNSVKLGEGGITKDVIEVVPFQRGIKTLIEYKKIIFEHQVEKIISLGTSAIRGASNGNEFIIEVKKHTDIFVEMISGDREAELIYYGTRSALNIGNKNALIMDIGGGSTEFIIANNDKIVWKKSFLLGIARLLEKFSPSDPITENEILALENYLKTELQDLEKALLKFPVQELIGSSGVFDSFAEMIVCQFYPHIQLHEQSEFVFDLADFEKIHQQIIRTTKAERYHLKGLIEMRIEMVVISSIFVNLVLKNFNLTKMRLSTFALKEGVLWELLQKMEFKK